MASRIVLRLQVRYAVQAFETWERQAQEQGMLQRKSRKIVWRIMRACFVQCFQVWVERARLAREVRDKLRQVSLGVFNGIARGSLARARR